MYIKEIADYGYLSMNTKYLIQSSLKTSIGRIVAAVAATTGDADIFKHKVRAAAITTENVVILAIAHSTSDINEGDVLNLNAIGRLAGRTAVEVILLDIDTVVGDAGDGDVLVTNVGHLTGGSGVRFDSASIRAVDDLRVGEGHPVNGVVALATDGADAQPVAAVAVNVVHDDVCAA